MGATCSLLLGYLDLQLACQAAGAIGMIVYNRDDVPCSNDFGSVSDCFNDLIGQMPVVGITVEQGKALVQAVGAQNVTATITVSGPLRTLVTSLSGTRYVRDWCSVIG